jgi:hypothetical protein
MNPATLQHAVLALVVVIGFAAAARFEMLCLKDLAQTPDEELRYLTRQGWLLVITFSIPFGGLLYLQCGRPR